MGLKTLEFTGEAVWPNTFVHIVYIEINQFESPAQSPDINPSTLYDC